jgi:hypothetical protein
MAGCQEHLLSGAPRHLDGAEQEALMSVATVADNLSAVVHHALETTRATVTCPFHLTVTIRVGDDAAESHALARAKKVIRSDGTHWEDAALRSEFERQLGEAADRYCPRCACLVDDPGI